MPRPADKCFNLASIISEIVLLFIKYANNQYFLQREGSEAEDAGVNDSPVDCQSRVLTEPQREMLLPYIGVYNSPLNRNLNQI